MQIKKHISSGQSGWYRIEHPNGSMGGLTDLSSIIDDKCIISESSKIIRSDIVKFSIITNSTLKNCFVSNSVVRDINVNNFTIKDSIISNKRDLFTWFDKEHIIFEYDELSQRLYFKQDHNIYMMHVVMDMKSGTYIGKYNAELNEIVILWNVNEKCEATVYLI